MPVYRIQLNEPLTSAELVARARSFAGFNGTRPGSQWIAREVKFRRALGHAPRELEARERQAADAVELSFRLPNSEDGWLALFVPGQPLEIAPDEDAAIEPALRALAKTLGGTLLVDDE